MWNESGSIEDLIKNRIWFACRNESDTYNTKDYSGSLHDMCVGVGSNITKAVEDIINGVVR